MSEDGLRRLRVLSEAPLTKSELIAFNLELQTEIKITTDPDLHMALLYFMQEANSNFYWRNKSRNQGQARAEYRALETLI